MTENQDMRVIEVNGHKFEVDLRTAKKIDTYRVGDKVKVLVKEYSDHKVYAGWIVGIDAFKALPTIVIAYIPHVWSGDGEIKFAHLNAKSEGVEIVPMCEDDVAPNREQVCAMFDRAIAKKRNEMTEIESKKEYFLRRFGAVAMTVEMPAPTNA